MEQQRKEMAAQMKKMKEENERLRNDYEKEHKHRRKLLNEVETLKGSIRVLCRIRPMSKTGQYISLLYIFYIQIMSISMRFPLLYVSS